MIEDDAVMEFFEQVLAEMKRAEELHHNADNSHMTWATVLSEEVGEAACAALQRELYDLQTELVQIASVAASWYIASNRKQPPPEWR